MVTPDPSSPLLGREAEWASCAAFLGDIAFGPCALLIEGEAGIGKTAIWQAAVRVAHPTNRDELGREPFVHQLDCSRDALEQQFGSEAGDKGPISPTDIRHTGRDQGLDGLPDRVPGRSDRRGQVGFRRQSRSGRELIGCDHLANVLNDASVRGRRAAVAPG